MSKSPNEAGSEAWFESKNREIASLWHNPEGLAAPAGWQALAASLKRQAEVRPVGAAPQVGETKLENWLEFASESGAIRASAFVETFPDGDRIKHVIADVAVREAPQARELTQRFALTIEPDQPPFFWTADKAGGGYECHLTWPQDWDTSMMKLIKAWGHVGRPAWPSPMFIVVKGFTRNGMPSLSLPDARYGVLTPGEFEGKLVRGGFYAWRKGFAQNLKLLTLAELYLNELRGKDLFELELTKSVANELVDAIGRPFFVSVFALIQHRLGPCPECGRVVCSQYANPDQPVDRDKVQAEATGVDHARQFGGADVWPLGREMAFFDADYVCPNCKLAHQSLSMVRLREPPAVLPDWGSIQAAIPGGGRS